MPRGGYRKGGGRPLGSKDRVPRGRNGFDQLKAMVREAEATEYIYTNDNKEFTGTAMEFLQSVYKCEHLPVKIRVYAAKEAMSIERDAGTPQFDETGKVILFLPHNRRDPLGLHDDDDYKDKIMEELDRLGREHNRQRDETLHTWISEDRLSEEQALLVRTLWVEEGDFAWEPVQQRTAPAVQYIAPPVEYSTAASEIVAKPVQNGADSEKPKAGNKPVRAGFVVLFTEPFRAFWVGNRKYEASEHGEILVDELEIEDARTLRQAGCRTRR
jgi:hypothetical protein